MCSFFDDKYYNQLHGTAMGTKMAPVYATLFLGYLEETMYVKVKDIMGQNVHDHIKTHWVRYVDDCFLIWNDNLGKIEELKSILESLHDSIGFKQCSNGHNIPFLDIDVHIDSDNSIQTDIFYKITDTHQYLDFHSCHPRHTKINIPFNLARRICTITSQVTNRNKRLSELKSILLQRNYPIKVIQNGIEKALRIDRKVLLSSKSKTKDDNNNILTFVHTHNPNNTNMGKVVNDSIHMLNQSKKLAKVLDTTKLIMSKRQSPNLKKILTRAALPKTIQGSSTKCGDKRCGTCSYIYECETFIFKNQKTFQIRHPMNCKSKNLIYVMTCNGCGEHYIGQTGDKLCTRMTVHCQQIRDPSTRQLPVSDHLETCNRNPSKLHFMVVPILKINSDDKAKRIAAENWLINLFNPKLNK